MNIETERKYTVENTRYKEMAFKSTYIKQGYIAETEKSTVRIRIRNKKGYLTIKGRGNDSGMSRPEWEKEIPLKEAEELFTFCRRGIIEKKRYEINFEGHIFEVDEFYGENKGLTIAEVELSNENEEVKLPGWIKKEVTGDKRYYNLSLSKNPYIYWKKE